MHIREMSMTSMASRARVWIRSPLIQKLWAELEALRTQDDVLYVYPMPIWREHAIITSVANNFFDLQHKDMTITDPTTPTLQAKIHKWVLNQANNNILLTTIAKRIPTITNHDVTEEQLKKFLVEMPKYMRLVPGFAQVGLLRSLFAAWNTKARYGDHGHKCRWCSLKGADSVTHYLVCTKMMSILGRVNPVLMEEWADFLHPPFLPILRPQALGIGLEGMLLQIAIWHDVLHSVYSISKHGNVHSFSEAAQARMRVSSRYSPRLQQCILEDYIWTSLAEA